MLCLPGSYLTAQVLKCYWAVVLEDWQRSTPIDFQSWNAKIKIIAKIKNSLDVTLLSEKPVFQLISLISDDTSLSFVIEFAPWCSFSLSLVDTFCSKSVKMSKNQKVKIARILHSECIYNSFSKPDNQTMLWI